MFIALCDTVTSFRDKAWLTEGVTLVSNNNGSVLCSCSHLTNFAVLTSVDGAGTQNVPGESDSDTKALAIITYVAPCSSTHKACVLFLSSS